MKNKTTFYVPHKIQLHYGSIFFDYRTGLGTGDLVDLKERGLDGICEENENGEITGEKHSWFLLPMQRGQKQYLLCLNCGERSHL